MVGDDILTRIARLRKGVRDMDRVPHVVELGHAELAELVEATGWRVYGMDVRVVAEPHHLAMF